LHLKADKTMIKTKKEIRREVKQAVLALSAAEREAQSQRVCEQIKVLIAEYNPATVALFSPLPDEVDITPLVADVGCRVVLPRVGDMADGTPEMEFFDYDAKGLSAGAYGIMEPQDGEPCRAEEIDLMVVPGVAFAEDGRRLGRGKGYYDRYLSRAEFRAFTVGVCYGCQLRDDIPAEPHDKKVDMVVVAK
jgi:5-formyltetrahydrofolate cyclo-ligase